MSVREKALVKRRVNREHNSNFRAGYVPINEEHLHKTGVRGRKAYAVYGVTILVAVMALVNIVLTWLIMGILYIDQNGVRSLEFTPGGRLLRFLQDTEIEDLLPVQSTVGGAPDEGLELSGYNFQELQLRVAHNNSTKASVTLTKDNIVVDTEEGFSVTDPDSGQVIFSDNYDKYGRFPEDVNHLQVPQLSTKRVTSGVNERLGISSKTAITLHGHESVDVHSSIVKISAKGDLSISTSDALVFESQTGYILDQVSSFDVTPSPLEPPAVSYKICVCMPSGKLFGVPAHLTCHNGTSLFNNPCA